MSVLYADTSAILRAYFADEQEHETLRSQLLEGDEPVVTSEITRLEVASAATASARAGRIADPAVVLAAFDADCADDGPITLLALEPRDALTRAVDLVQQQRLRSLDAIHVAVALSVVHLIAAEDLSFVTRDHAQGVAATALGMTVR